MGKDALTILKSQPEYKKTKKRVLSPLYGSKCFDSSSLKSSEQLQDWLRAALMTKIPSSHCAHWARNPFTFPSSSRWITLTPKSSTFSKAMELCTQRNFAASFTTNTGSPTRSGAFALRNLRSSTMISLAVITNGLDLHLCTDQPRLRVIAALPRSI